MDGRLAASLLLERGDDLACAFFGRQPVEAAGVHELAVFADHLDRGQAERLGELGVALVVGGDSHDRAGAIVHQDVVGDPDRQLLAIDRVDDMQAGEDAGLLRGGGALLDRPGAGVARLLLRLVVRMRLHERMLGRDDEEVAPKSVSAAS